MFFLNRACYAQRFEPLQNRHILQPGCLLGENNSCQSAAAKLGKWVAPCLNFAASHFAFPITKREKKKTLFMYSFISSQSPVAIIIPFVSLRIPIVHINWAEQQGKLCPSPSKSNVLHTPNTYESTFLNLYICHTQLLLLDKHVVYLIVTRRDAAYQTAKDFLPLKKVFSNNYTEHSLTVHTGGFVACRPSHFPW